MALAVKPSVVGGKNLRVGVIGAGVMGSNHARVFGGLADVTLVGIADPLDAHRNRATDLIGCRTFESFEALLSEGVDAVTIAAPTHLHHEIALACIAKKIHVMVEKPIASTVEEGREIVAAARRANVTLMVGHVERFNPAVTESEIIEVQPQLSSAVAEREDIALLQFRTASGVLAHINTNWLTPFKARNVTVATRGKYVMGDLLTRQVTECFGFQPDGSYSMRHLSVGYEEPLRSELAAFVSAVRLGGTPAVTGDEGVASLEIAIQCLDSSSTREKPDLRIEPRRAAGA
jgi:UDP-N-acetylglucosamine 3-dehydrogenase